MFREKAIARAAVIASEAKQSISPRKRSMDCFVAFAPRNDGGLVTWLINEPYGQTKAPAALGDRGF